jgi:hypothetical protein
MEKSQGSGRWSWRKILGVSLAIVAVVVLAIIVVTSGGSGSGGLY